MTGQDLETEIKAIGLKKADFIKMTGVNARTFHHHISNNRFQTLETTHIRMYKGYLNYCTKQLAQGKGPKPTKKHKSLHSPTQKMVQSVLEFLNTEVLQLRESQSMLRQTVEDLTREIQELKRKMASPVEKIH